MSYEARIFSKVGHGRDLPYSSAKVETTTIAFVASLPKFVLARALTRGGLFLSSEGMKVYIVTLSSHLFVPIEFSHPSIF